MQSLLGHVRFCLARARSLLLQLEAQDQLRAGNLIEAARQVRTALEGDPFAEDQSKEIQAWIGKFPQHAGILPGRQPSKDCRVLGPA